ncbi:MAG: hypothetical protein KGL39_60775, partial [Patescibacteria group bacterium]|nr:hypothetical protein [Patescibacteria group bacterium]
IGKKIREAAMQKIPYQLILGEKEAKSGGAGSRSAWKVAVRTREGKDLGALPLKKFLARIQTEIEKKKGACLEQDDRRILYEDKKID